MWQKRRHSSSTSIQSTDESRKKRFKDNHIFISIDDEDAESSHSTDLDEDEWEINCILDETESQYLIDWKGDWSPTWEPKEHANDAAIQSWEQRRRRHSPDRQIEVPESESPPLPSPSRTRESFLRHRLEHRDSPLFVPYDTATNPPRARVNSEEPNTDSEPRQAHIIVVENVPSPRRSGLIDSKPITPLPGGISVFEYTSSSPIPSEYRLPGEFEDFTSPCPRRTPPRSVGGLQKTDSLLISETIRKPEKPKSTVSPTTQQPSVALNHNQDREAEEIAETPSGLLNLGSQRSHLFPGSRNSGTQQSVATLDYRSIYSSMVSQTHTSGNTSQRDTSVPRLITVVPQSSTTPCTPSTSQESLHVRSRYLASQAATRIMENQTPKKEVLSLSETMEKYSQLEGSTPREKLRNAYAQLSARNNASAFQNADASATPSSAGDIEASAPISIPETIAPLSVRVDNEPHHAQTEAALAPPVEPAGLEPVQQANVQTIQPSALTVNPTEEAPPGSVHLGPSEFAVPLPMDSRIKDDYEQVLRKEPHGIREFLKISGSKDGTAGFELEHLSLKMHEVLKHMSNVATHPDLNIAEHIKDSGSDLGKEAAWAEYSSAKFLFLGYLVDIASTRDLHLVILVHGEKTQKVVERYLMGKGLVHTRPREEMGPGTNVEVSMAKGSLSFGIQSTQNDDIVETYKTPSAIIALDSSFNAKSPSVEHMRTTFARHGHLLPVIRLVVSNSSEHIELCFPNLPELQRLRLVIQYTVHLRDMVGDLQDDALGVREDVEEILPCLLSDNLSASWPLSSIEPLHIVSPDALDSLQIEGQNQTNTDHASYATPAQKRLFQVEEPNGQSSKRPRIDVSQDTSQLTQSSKFPSQTLDRDLQALEKHLVQMRNVHAVELEKLREALTAMKTHLQEKETILGSLQHRYESRTKDLHKIRQERDQLVESKKASEQKVEKQREDIGKLKDERTQLRHELEESREELKSGGGSVAELETAREEIRRLTKENAGLERKADYESRQAEYTREQYQTASTVAAQSGNEMRQLREENEVLKRKASGEASRLKELNTKGDEARHLSRISELEGTLSHRDDLLRRKEEELREIRKNRPSTRSTSTQPRSPKLAAGNSRPTSPGINNNGSTIAGRGSALRFSSEMSL